MRDEKLLLWYEKLLQFCMKILDPLHRDAKTGKTAVKKT